MTDDDVVTIERTFDAPVGLIWRMWTDPEHFKAWYGPAGATVPVAEMDVRVGGRRLLCMEVSPPSGPMRMWSTGEYREVIDNRRLVYTDSMSDEHGNVAPSDMNPHPAVTEVHVELDDLAGRTKMLLTHIGLPAGSPGATGWTMALDKLAAHVATMVTR